MKTFWKKKLPACLLSLALLMGTVPMASAAWADLTYDVDEDDYVFIGADDFENYFDNEAWDDEFYYLEFTDVDDFDDYGYFTADDDYGDYAELDTYDLYRGYFFKDGGDARDSREYDLDTLYFETYDGIRGRGLLDLARETIALDAMAQRYGKKFYQNGARLSGVLEIDSDANPDTRQKLKKEFQSYASDDAFAVAVVDHGMKFTPLGVSQSDAQFIETRNFSVEEISRFTGIPKHMLQTGKESYNSNAQQRLNYVTDTLLPYVVQWESEDSYKLPTPQDRRAGVYIRGNVEVLLRADPTTRASFYEKMIQHAISHLLKNRTSFLIAHRLSTIRSADLILVVRAGKIVERGTHAELLAQRGYYATLYRNQFEQEAAENVLGS